MYLAVHVSAETVTAFLAFAIGMEDTLVGGGNGNFLSPHQDNPFFAGVFLYV